MVDGDDAPFRCQRTRRPHPSSATLVATVAIQDDLIILQSTREELFVWEDVTDFETLKSLLLECNVEHLR